MQQDLNFRIKKIQDNEIHFICGDVTIIIDRFAYNNGKHEIIEPQKANAEFICCGTKYVVENTLQISNVEDWYAEELLPKMQMLSLLLTVAD